MILLALGMSILLGVIMVYVYAVVLERRIRGELHFRWI